MFFRAQTAKFLSHCRPGAKSEDPDAATTDSRREADSDLGDQ
ncbi:MAG: hypothetical protein OXG82_05465 [Gammaproteobacteria bacterium]|nr:hypothetical protein [Gammaproteobacteria bacterium]